MTARVEKYHYFWSFRLPFVTRTTIPDGEKLTINVTIPRFFGTDDRASFTVDTRPNYTTVTTHLPEDTDDVLISGNDIEEVLNEKRSSVQPILTAPYVVHHITAGKKSQPPEPNPIDYSL